MDVYKRDNSISTVAINKLCPFNSRCARSLHNDGAPICPWCQNVLQMLIPMYHDAGGFTRNGSMNMPPNSDDAWNLLNGFYRYMSLSWQAWFTYRNNASGRLETEREALQHELLNGRIVDRKIDLQVYIPLLHHALEAVKARAAWIAKPKDWNSWNPHVKQSVSSVSSASIVIKPRSVQELETENRKLRAKVEELQTILYDRKKREFEVRIRRPRPSGGLPVEVRQYTIARDRGFDHAFVISNMPENDFRADDIRRQVRKLAGSDGYVIIELRPGEDFTLAELLPGEVKKP